MREGNGGKKGTTRKRKKVLNSSMKKQELKEGTIKGKIREKKT